MSVVCILEQWLTALIARYYLWDMVSVRLDPSSALWVGWQSIDCLTYLLIVMSVLVRHAYDGLIRQI